MCVAFRSKLGTSDILMRYRDLMSNTAALLAFVRDELTALADPEKAAPMAAYMKTEQPFYGVQAGPRRRIAAEAARRLPPARREDYEAGVLALWEQPHREEKYIAIAWAREHPAFVEYDSLPLYEMMIRDGAWWDLVDEIAIHLVGTVLRVDPDRTWPVIDRYARDGNLWLRRTALICQNRMGARVDHRRLFAYCLAMAVEKDLFIQKAIGWALREYSYTNPEAVQGFLQFHRDELPGLSHREGSKRLRKLGLM